MCAGHHILMLRLPKLISRCAGNGYLSGQALLMAFIVVAISMPLGRFPWYLLRGSFYPRKLVQTRSIYISLSLRF